MMRLLFLAHRYLGIAVGALMVMWCLSGVVMMYHSYPALDENSRLRALAPIVWSGCCKSSEQMLADAGPASEFQMEMLAGRPVLYLRGTHKARLIDLMTGAAIDRVTSEQAAAVAKQYVENSLRTPANTGPKPPLRLDLIDHDQWTVSGGFDTDRPLYRMRLNDAMRTEVYVSSTSGRAVQITTGRERFWNWLGSVPHWLYFSELRRQASLWTQVVIAASLIGCFLAGTGIYIGVRQLLLRPVGRWSPYGGFNLWHHLAGLVFGVFALTWVLSGLLSMNPWGWLQAAGAQRERTQLRGPEPSGSQFAAALSAIADAPPSHVVSVNVAPFDGRLYVIASTADGERRRLDARGAPAPLSDIDLEHIAAALNGSRAAVAPELITREDSYYFSHHSGAVPLPVYRLLLRDGSGARYYVDPVSGELIAKIDRAAQNYRWWHEGLHRLDFTAGLRSRPQWDALMLLLMSGVTMLCVTGTYLGYRRLVRS